MFVIVRCGMLPIVAVGGGGKLVVVREAAVVVMLFLVAFISVFILSMIF